MSSKKLRPVRAAKAKAQLAETRRLARSGKAQVAGAAEPSIVTSERTWRQATGSGDGFGRWLVETTPRGAPLQRPTRRGTRRGDPLAVKEE